MNKTVMFLSGLALGGATLAAFSTFAFQGEPGKENPNPVDQERHEKVESMFENGNYQKFQELFDGRGPARVIDNEEEFNKFVELREAHKSGDAEKAQSLAKELGLGQRNGSRAGQGIRGNQGTPGQGMRGNQGTPEQGMKGHGMKGGHGMGKNMGQ